MKDKMKQSGIIESSLSLQTVLDEYLATSERDTPWREYPVKHGRIIEKLVVTISAKPSHREVVRISSFRHRMMINFTRAFHIVVRKDDIVDSSSFA